MANKVVVGLIAVVAFAAGLGGALMFRPHAETAQEPTVTTPEDALAELSAGNQRYVASHRTRSTDTAHDAADRHHLATEQHPFAAVLGCADSRVCPEFIFDQRPGAIFDVRNAGNLADDDVMASLEYAVEHLHVKVVLVLGHKCCGAVKAVHEAGEKKLPHHLHSIQDHMACIRPQLQAAHGEHSQEAVDKLAAENARGQAATLLKESEPLRKAVEHGEVRLVSGLYDLETGRVEIFQSK